MNESLQKIVGMLENKVEGLKSEIAKKDETIALLEKKLKEEKRYSGIDPLTGLYNRKYLNENISLLIDWAERYKISLSYLFVDLDNFKKINDCLGHIMGDEVLKLVADKFRKVSRHTDTYVRLGGDEFFMVLPGTDKKGAEDLAHRLETEITKISDEAKISGEYGFGCSIGILEHETGMSFQQVIENSDKDMYAVKERRKKR